MILEHMDLKAVEREGRVWARRSEMASKSSSRQYSRDHETGDQAVGKERWCEEDQWFDLGRNEINAVEFSRFNLNVKVNNIY